MPGPIPLSRVAIDAEIEEAVLAALHSGHYILGAECAAFEREFAGYVEAGHCVLSSSCTAALSLLHQAMGLNTGDEVIVPAHTAFPTIEPLIHCGARPIFVEIDETCCLDPEAVAAAVTPRTVGIIAVHLYGHPADMDRIHTIARHHALWVIEDCAQAHGALYRGRKVGAQALAGVFSFYPSKNLTVLGDGGCIVTNDAALAERVRMLRDHGRRSKYVHEAVGFNLRFNEIQAAIGRVMLRRLDEANARRRRLAESYRRRLAGLVTVPHEAPWAYAVYHLYVIRTPRRDALAAHLAAAGVSTGLHYPVPTHRQPGIIERFGPPPALPRTEALARELLSLPLYPDLDPADLDRICELVADFLRR
jgi:dTDP-4-amino-4,6-dideoxygalactose transaminase